MAAKVDFESLWQKLNDRDWARRHQPKEPKPLWLLEQRTSAMQSRWWSLPELTILWSCTMNAAYLYVHVLHPEKFASTGRPARYKVR